MHREYMEVDNFEACSSPVRNLFAKDKVQKGVAVETNAADKDLPRPEEIPTDPVSSPIKVSSVNNELKEEVQKEIEVEVTESEQELHQEEAKPEEAPIRSFFGKSTVTEEVQHGVEAVVNVAEQGLHQLDEATSGAVSSIADELSKAGVDLGKFKNSIVEKLEHDVEALKDDITSVETEVSKAGKDAVSGLSNMGQGLMDEVQNVETQTEAKVEEAEDAAKACFVKAGQGVESAIQNVTGVGDTIKKTEESAVETVSSLASGLESFMGLTENKQETTTKTNEPSNVSKETAPSNIPKETPPSTIDNVKEAVSTAQKNVEDTLLGMGESIVGGISNGIQNVENSVSKTEETLSDWTSSLLSNEKDASHKNKDSGATPKKESKVEDKTSSDVEKATPSQSPKPKKESPFDGWSSDQHFLRDTIVKSKDMVLDTLNLGEQHKKTKGEKSAPEFQSTQNVLSSSDTKIQAESSPKEQNSDNTPSHSEEKEISEEKKEKETSPVKEVGDFLNQEISESSKHGEAKVEEEKEVPEPANKEVAKHHSHSLFDSLTDMTSSVTNTLHNIETGIENAGMGILTGVGTKVKEAGDFLAGTEEVDEHMDDKELKTEAVTSLLDKPFLN